MTSRTSQRATTDSQLRDQVERLGREFRYVRASDIAIDTVDGLSNLDGSPCTNLQEAIEALAR